MEVQVPGLPVVPLQFGPGASADQQRVDLGGGVIDDTSYTSAPRLLLSKEA